MSVIYEQVVELKMPGLHLSKTQDSDYCGLGGSAGVANRANAGHALLHRRVGKGLLHTLECMGPRPPKHQLKQKSAPK